jgi:hypothetical protein
MAKLGTIAPRDYGLLLIHLSHVVAKRPPTDILEAEACPLYIHHLLAYYKCNPHRNRGKIVDLTALVGVLTFYYRRRYLPTPPSIVKYNKDANDAQDLKLAVERVERAKRGMLIADPRPPKRHERASPPPPDSPEWMVIDDDADPNEWRRVGPESE